MALADTIRQAREYHRMAIEQTFEDTCTVIEYQSITNPTTKITKQTEVAVLSDQPCKLSFSSANPTEKSENVASVSQVVKLFIPVSTNINPGSKIVVSHNGATHTYKSSGEPNAFHTHKEIALELFRGWA